jgi:hypothetical protein
MIERVSSQAPFRDIRPDLRDRLRDALRRRDDLAAKMKDSEAEVDDCQRMLEREEARHQLSAGGNSAAKLQPKEELRDFIFKAIQMRPQNKDDLRHSVESAGYKVDGRSIHATTVNLLRRGRIVEISKGVFASADSDLVKSTLKAPAH